MTKAINNTEMYDTVIFRKRINDYDSIVPIVANLENAHEIISVKTGEVLGWNGYCRNLDVFVSHKYLRVNGSLPKYYIGNNVERFSRLQAKEAIQSLSDTLHVNMNMANITGLDFSATIKVKNPVPEYLSLFGSCSTFVKVFYGTTVYYNPTTKAKIKPTQLCIYDKVAECVDNKFPIPREYINNNLLRYELKLRQRLGMRFERVEIVGRTLYEPEFYALMMEKWVKTYFEINKNNVMRYDYMNNIKTPGDAFDAYVATLISKADNGCFEAFVRELKHNKVFARTGNYNRLKEIFARINSNTLFTDSSSLIDELDKNIRDIGESGE